MAYDFKGKVILVTGAGAGIGKAIVQKLRECGAEVIAVSLLRDELDQLVKEFPGVRTIQVDLRLWNETRKALENVGRVDGLVNNAGVAITAPFLDVTEDQIDKTFDINVKAVINVSQIISKSMIENGIKGSIVNISSIAALTSQPSASVYCSSKGAVQSVTRVMAVELGRNGIRVNSVNPTAVQTELSKFIWQSEKISASLHQRTPLGRFATTREVANAVAFLLSDDAAMVNGIPLPVDGGYMNALDDHTAYCASKSAVDGITRAMALELAVHGIRTNSVNPTVVMTELGQRVWADTAKKQKLLCRLPLGRFAQVDDIVEPILFLLSKHSSMVHGVMLPIDGGYNIA